MLFSGELMSAWQSHQSVFATLLQDHYLRNTLGVKILPLDLLPTGQVVSQQTQGHGEIEPACLLSVQWIE
jgi:hypothetical protein